jgi:WD40 repeat protein
VSGGESGNVEYWDYRQREKVNIDVLNQGSEITEISTKGNASGLQFAVGSANGVVRVYDIRNTRRVQYEVRNQYRFPINGIQFIQNSRFLVSSNKKVIKINDLQQ